MQRQSRPGAAKQHDLDASAAQHRLDHGLEAVEGSTPLLVLLRAGQGGLCKLQQLVPQHIQPGGGQRTGWWLPKQQLLLLLGCLCLGLFLLLPTTSRSLVRPAAAGGAGCRLLLLVLSVQLRLRATRAYAYSPAVAVDCVGCLLSPAVCLLLFVIWLPPVLLLVLPVLILLLLLVLVCLLLHPIVLMVLLLLLLPPLLLPEACRGRTVPGGGRLVCILHSGLCCSAPRRAHSSTCVLLWGYFQSRKAQLR